MGSKRFSIMAVFLSLLGAIIAFILGELILKAGNEWPAYLSTGLYFGIGAMAISAMVIISQKISPVLIGYRWKEMYYKNSLKWFIPTTLIMTGLAAGILQIIYSVDIHKEETIKNIVIAVDTSSSMTITDPDKERFMAIGSLIDNLQGDKNVALITFNDNTSLDIDFMPVKNDEEKQKLKSKINSLNIEEIGQTGIRMAVDEAYNMLNNSNGKGSLILVSDGAPTDGSQNDISGLVSSFTDDGIPVYTIGMMYSYPDEANYLQEIAQLTGGEFFNTSNTAMLKEAFGNISYNEDKGTLITSRSGIFQESVFYKTLRIGFVTVISFLIALALGIMFDNKYLAWGMFIGGITGGITGSLAMEISMAKDMPQIIGRMLYWIIFGIALLAFTWCVSFKDSHIRER